MKTAGLTPLRIGIAGAGIMGRLLAWQFINQGHRVSLFEKDLVTDGSAASFTAAGMLAPYSELETAETSIYQLGRQGLGLWPQIVDALQVQDSFYQQGTLVVAHPQDRAELLHFNRQLTSKLPADQSAVRQLTQLQLTELEPTLAARFTQATLLADECWLHNGDILAALAKQLLQRGVDWRANTAVEAISAGMIRTAEASHSFDWAIDCRGLGARTDIPSLRGVRGELVWVHAPAVNIQRMVRLMHPRYRLYLVPQKNHHYVVGATEIESEDSGHISVRSTLELLTALYSIDPGFAEATLVETKANCRPALLDNQPLLTLGDGLIRINGLYRHGFMLAPVLAAKVLGYVSSQPDRPTVQPPTKGVTL